MAKCVDLEEMYYKNVMFGRSWCICVLESVNIAVIWNKCLLEYGKMCGIWRKCAIRIQCLVDFGGLVCWNLSMLREFGTNVCWSVSKYVEYNINMCYCMVMSNVFGGQVYLEWWIWKICVGICQHCRNLEQMSVGACQKM